MVNKPFTKTHRAGDAGAVRPRDTGFWGWFMRCIGIAVLGALLCLPALARAELLVSISKSQQRLSVTVDGTEAYRWPVSTGRRGHATPAGSFHPIRLERHWYSHQYGMTPMPWAVFFHRGYAVHGTTEAYNLGHAASHGCVRLRPDNASILYSLVRQEGTRNTRIVVMNGPLPAAPGATTLVEADAPKVRTAAEQHFAQALDRIDEQHFSAKTHADADLRHEEVKPAIVHRDAARASGHVVRRASAGNGEAHILRERQAWLRSLDRKYGIAR